MDRSEVRVSIITPAYNAAATVGRAVASALRQTEQRVEVLVVDDASADATPALVQRLAEQDGRIRLLRQAINSGPAAARNRGLAHAQGEWIALLDADDEFAPDRVARLTALAEDHGADLVADNLLLCQAGNHGDAEPMLSPERLPQAKWLSAAEFVAGNVGSRYRPRVSYGFFQPLIRRSFLEDNKIRYEERNRFGEDYLLALTCLLKGARWWVTPEAMYRYMVRPGSATDVQSAADLLRIRRFEERLLRSHPMVAADPALAAALRRHKSVIEHFYYYRAFTDALKAGTVGPALRFLLGNPGGLHHIVSESALQGPRVAMKALRGGYHRRRPTVQTINEPGTSQRPRREA